MRPGPAGNSHCHAVVLAGGRGERFWPRSRANRPKQLLDILGKGTLLRRTVDRLLPVFSPERIWVFTAHHLREAVAAEMADIPADHIIGEPTERNTAPTLGLAAAVLHRRDPDAVLAVFPSDHLIQAQKPYEQLMRRALAAACDGHLIVVGVQPRWAETGYGYIEFPPGTQAGSEDLLNVASFREKPDLADARRFVGDGRFYWNSGQFFWQAAAFGAEMQRHMPDTWATLSAIVDGPDSGFETRLAAHYRCCERISVDKGILERSHLVRGFAAPDLGWSDLGSWKALHAASPKDGDGNVASSRATFVDSSGNLVDVPGKRVALLGMEDTVVVETQDALLICRRDEAQNVRAVVDALRAEGLEALL